MLVLSPRSSSSFLVLFFGLIVVLVLVFGRDLIIFVVRVFFVIVVTFVFVVFVFVFVVFVVPVVLIVMCRRRLSPTVRRGIFLISITFWLHTAELKGYRWCDSFCTTYVLSVQKP